MCLVLLDRGKLLIHNHKVLREKEEPIYSPEILFFPQFRRNYSEEKMFEKDIAYAPVGAEGGM